MAVFAAPRRVGRLAGLRALRSGGRGLGLGPRGVGRRRAGAVAQRGRPPGFGGQPGQLRRPFPGRDGGRGQPRPVGFEGLGPRVQLGDAGVGGLGPGGGLRAPHRRGVGGVGQLTDRRTPVPPRPHAGQEVAVAVQPGRQPFEIGRARTCVASGSSARTSAAASSSTIAGLGGTTNSMPGATPSDATAAVAPTATTAHGSSRAEAQLGAGPGGIGGVVEQHATDQVRQPLDHCGARLGGQHREVAPAGVGGDARRLQHPQHVLDLRGLGKEAAFAERAQRPLVAGLLGEHGGALLLGGVERGRQPLDQGRRVGVRDDLLDTQQRGQARVACERIADGGRLAVRGVGVLRGRAGGVGGAVRRGPLRRRRPGGPGAAR